MHPNQHKTCSPGPQYRAIFQVQWCACGCPGLLGSQTVEAHRSPGALRPALEPFGLHRSCPWLDLCVVEWLGWMGGWRGGEQCALDFRGKQSKHKCIHKQPRTISTARHHSSTPVKTSCAPNALSSTRRSSDIDAGMVRMSL